MHNYLTKDGGAVNPGPLAGGRSSGSLFAPYTRFVEHYNAVRLHSAIGYVTPKDMLAGRADEDLLPTLSRGTMCGGE